MFLRHARTARFAAAYLLLFTAALVLMVPKVNVPETLFDEANTSTNEIETHTDDPSSEYRPSDIAVLVSHMFGQSPRIDVRRILPVDAGQLTDTRTFRELFCTLLC